jgi:peptidylamidoglycolate lyase
MNARTVMVVSAALVLGSVRGALGAGAASSTYEVVHGWPELPTGKILGQATGVGVDSHGNVYVFHRAGREWAEPLPTEPIVDPTVWVFDGRSGRLLRSWGADLFVMPHGLTIDAHDNVWLTDVGLQQVFKFSPDGRLLLAIGEARVSGCDSTHFNMPTDVAVLRDGSFYVSDGYGNTRVIKFSSTGRFLLAWGSPGSGPGQFDLPHGITVDDSGRVYVADRGNARIQVFDGNGRFLTQWRGGGLGRPYAIALSNDGHALVADGGDQPSVPPDRSTIVVLDRAGRITDRFGRFGNYDGQFRMVHDVATGPDGSVYAVDASGQRVQKFVRRRR